MKKDYIAVATLSEHETQFVEDFWTQVWERERGPDGAIERIPKKDEYRLMAPYLANLPQSARILDGGCGLGEWTLALSKMGYEVVGMDLSRRVVKQLQERFKDALFVAGDIRKMDFANDSFDAYFSWGVFEHFEAGPGDCLREAYRVLNPGGLMFISVPLDNLRQSLLGTFAAARPHEPGERFYQYRFTRSELAREISLSGFELVSFHPIHKRQGVLRALHHEFGMPYKWLLTRGLAFALAPLVPGWWIGHMMLAVARKPGP